MEIIKQLAEIPDLRREQAKKYELKYILFFTLLALISNAKGYSDIHLFMTTHFKLLKKMFKLKWKNPPCNNGIISILEKVDSNELEKCLIKRQKSIKGKFIAVDGKALRGSIDHANNGVVKQLLKVFACEELLVLAHEEIDKKTNEIPVFQELIKKLEIEGKTITMDAIHCQKKL
jgi:DDE_Tnp_1-associated